MSHHYTVARPYAKAVFQQALADDCLEQWSVVLQGLSVITTDPSLEHLFDDPKVSDTVLMDLIYETLMAVARDATAGLSDKLKNFLSLLLEEKRLQITRDINTLFHQLLAAHKSVVEIEVVSCLELTEEQKQAFYTSLEKRFASKVSINFQQDDTLIGGALVRSGNWVLDGSIRGKIARLDEALMS